VAYALKGAKKAMAAIVLFATQLPSWLTDEFTRAGFTVFEVLAISEVLHLCETKSLDAVVIEADVDDQRAHVIEQHYMTMRLKPETKASEVVWELSLMFPAKTANIQ
jgi:hypothetical protein